MECNVLAVSGGRDYADREHVFAVLDAVEPRPYLLVHGACGMKLDRFGRLVGRLKGADLLADEWARSRNVRIRLYPADWDRYGGPAGPKRNYAMLHTERPFLLVAFPGGNGTQSAVDIAVQLDIKLQDERARTVPTHDGATANPKETRT